MISGRLPLHVIEKLSFPFASLEILKDWINLIDDDGWVAREQILGEEARSKVCYYFYPFLAP